MYDFIVSFIGSPIADYPFLVSILSIILSGVIFFMFYSIIATLFKVR